jgi:hypothetical protein
MLRTLFSATILAGALAGSAMAQARMPAVCWIARVKASGHTTLEEEQMKFHIERYGNIVHIWSSYALYSDGEQVARGINSIQAIKEAGGWRVTGIMVQSESATAPLPKEYLP